MTYDETLAIMSVLKAAYPSYYKGMKREDAEKAVELWASMFAGDDPQQVVAAVKALIATDVKGFPPHIGAVKDKLRKITSPHELTEIEAWSMVHKAIKRGLYNSKEEFDKFPPMVQRLVGSPNQLRDWAMMDGDTVQSVVASNFQRSFRVRSEHDREYCLLPPDVKELMDSFSKHFALDGAIGSLGDGH